MERVLLVVVAHVKSWEKKHFLRSSERQNVKSEKKLVDTIRHILFLLGQQLLQYETGGLNSAWSKVVLVGIVHVLCDV